LGYPWLSLNLGESINIWTLNLWTQLFDQKWSGFDGKFYDGWYSLWKFMDTLHWQIALVELFYLKFKNFVIKHC
jgi:hypothetical protein